MVEVVCEVIVMVEVDKVGWCIFNQELFWSSIYILIIDECLEFFVCEQIIVWGVMLICILVEV